MDKNIDIPDLSQTELNDLLALLLAKFQLKSDLERHEAVCDERNKRFLMDHHLLVEAVENNHREVMEAVKLNADNIAELKDLATQGKTTLKTLFMIGAAVVAIAGLVFGGIEALSGAS